MNDQQSEEMIKQLRRIADALDHIKSSNETISKEEIKKPS